LSAITVMQYQTSLFTKVNLLVTSSLERSDEKPSLETSQFTSKCGFRKKIM